MFLGKIEEPYALVEAGALYRAAVAPQHGVDCSTLRWARMQEFKIRPGTSVSRRLAPPPLSPQPGRFGLGNSDMSRHRQVPPPKA